MAARVVTISRAEAWDMRALRAIRRRLEGPWRFDRESGGRLYGGADHHGAFVSAQSGELEVLRRAAVELGSLLYHIDILFVAHPGNGAVVLDADKQTTSGVVGEGREGAGYLHGVRDRIFEVLTLVLAFSDDALKVIFSLYRLDILHFSRLSVRIVEIGVGGAQ